MKMQVLGCSGAQFPGRHTSAFLLDETFLLDAGTVCEVLTAEEQQRVSHIALTHSHLDHIRGIPLLADNLIIGSSGARVTIAGCRETLQAMRTHLLNDVLWPDFSLIPSVATPIVTYLELEPLQPHRVGDFSITAVPVDHSIPAVGYVVEKNGATLVYTGDTGPTELLWRHAQDADAAIVEVSLPDSREDFALLTRHLTPRLLQRELKKMKGLPGRLLVTHMKPQFEDEIRSQLAQLAIPGLSFLHEGDVYEI